jgi:hypothetical protein
MQKASRSMVGTVVDTSFHLTQGYATCTTELGIVQVAGIPLGTVIPGMRVYCRRLGTMSSNRTYLFDGYAGTLSSLGPNGSLLIAASSSLSSGCATVSTVPAASGISSSSGYYWHGFFYLPSVPTSTVTLLQFAQTGSLTTTFTVQMTTACLLQVISSDGHGYVTTTAIAPHQLHWFLIQPGYSGSALLIDGIAAYTYLSGTSDPTFAGNTNTYSVSLGANVNGTQLLPIGSWLSKVGYGASSSQFSATLPSLSTVPAYDTDLVNANAGGIVTKLLYLFEDTPGSATAVNSASGWGSGTLAVSSPAQIVQAGPY